MQTLSILVINGPNLNMLGQREAAHYGGFTLADVETALRGKAATLATVLRFFQSNIEGEIVTAIQQAASRDHGILINAGAYTHTSYAILDALSAVRLPTVEVHISDIRNREPFRRLSVIRSACAGQICGRGLHSYTDGLEELAALIRGTASTPAPTPAPAPLHALRDDITRTDAELIRLFNHRLELATRIARAKAGTGAPVYDPAREADVLAHAAALTTPDKTTAVTAFMSTLMRLSRERQYALPGLAPSLPACPPAPFLPVHGAAFGGTTGSYSELAARTLFPRATLLPAWSFADACAQLKSGACDAAVLPLANTTGGYVNPVYRLLEDGLYITRALDLPVRHCLAAPAAATLATVTRVTSHPQALAQCDREITRRRWQALPCENTAHAARHVAQANDPALAAICSHQAARSAGLRILSDDITDNDANHTRFIVLMRRPLATPDASRLALLLHLPHVPGALASVLASIAGHGLNLASISAQPLPGKPWEYAFFLDIETPPSNPAIQPLLARFNAELPLCRFAGWYAIQTSGGAPA